MGKPQKYTGKGGKRYWRVQYKLANGKRPTFRLGSIRESAANKISDKIANLVSSIRHGIKPDGDTLAWLSKDADTKLVERLESVGLCGQCRDIVEARRRLEDGAATVPTVSAFVAWYVNQRKADCETSTVRKIKSSLEQFDCYCRAEEDVKTIAGVDHALAFRYQLHRQQNRAEATVSKDVKILKTAFGYAVKSGWLQSNPITGLKNGSEVNPDGQYIVPVEDYLKLIAAAPSSTWRAIIALGRLGGLRMPSELVNLKWEHINWDNGTILVTSPKTKRYGKAQRTIPLYIRLETELADHFELTGSTSEYVIDNPVLRRRNANLRTSFNRIREKAGVVAFDNPFRNLRLSAANDVCRMPGITMKTVTQWFGHDITTALKHYHRVTESDFENARTVDPFKLSNLGETKSDAQGDARMPLNSTARECKDEKTPGFRSPTLHKEAKSDPYGTRTRVAGVKGRSPRPLDEGAVLQHCVSYRQSCEGTKVNFGFAFRQGQTGYFAIFMACRSFI